MKLIVGIFFGVFISLTGYAFAQDSIGILLVERILDPIPKAGIYKYYDSNNEVVCYAFNGPHGAGLHCLKNP